MLLENTPKLFTLTGYEYTTLPTLLMLTQFLHYCLH